MQKDSWFIQACMSDGVDCSAMVQKISDFYDNHDTVLNAFTRHAWHKLNVACESESKRYKAMLNVRTEKRTGQPYYSELDMFTDISQGWLLVSTENTDHPLASAQDTHNSRIWHDLTHYATKANFGFLGESKVCKAQSEHASRIYTKDSDCISHALYLDIVCQVASGLVYRQFPIQKTF